MGRHTVKGSTGITSRVAMAAVIILCDPNSRGRNILINGYWLRLRMPHSLEKYLKSSFFLFHILYNILVEPHRKKCPEVRNSFILPSVAGPGCLSRKNYLADPGFKFFFHPGSVSATLILPYFVGDGWGGRKGGQRGWREEPSLPRHSDTHHPQRLARSLFPSLICFLVKRRRSPNAYHITDWPGQRLNNIQTEVFHLLFYIFSQVGR